MAPVENRERERMSVLDQDATLAIAQRQEQLRDLLETQRALLVGVIRRFESARRLIPLRSADHGWTGPAKNSFDDAIGSLMTELDDTGRALERAQLSIIQALVDVVGRVG